MQFSPWRMQLLEQLDVTTAPNSATKNLARVLVTQLRTLVGFLKTDCKVVQKLVEAEKKEFDAITL